MSTRLQPGAPDAAQLFARHGYVSLPGGIAPEICALATRYALMQEEVDLRSDGPDGQVPGAHSVYGDALMESLLDTMRPRIEQLAGLRLFATYSYYRVYRPGAELNPHRDREACEISASVCLGSRYLHDDSGYSWPLCFGASAGSGKGAIVLRQEPGDLVLYRGRDLKHWRERFAGRPGSYLVQVFLHYVDQDGPCRDYRYDKREGLGRRSKPEEERVRALLDQAFPELARGKR
jgi:hypothetical protein